MIRLVCNFTVEYDTLKKLVEFAQKNLTKESWSEYFEESNSEFKKFKQSTKSVMLLTFIALGLLKMGFDEEKTLTILENLIEIDKKCLSPGNSLIH
jgi:hypothetical protein